MSSSAEQAKAEPKRTAGDHTSNVWSNYLFCPTLCRSCNEFYEEDSNWPYHCKANSTRAKSYRSESEGYKQYDDCICYKERERNNEENNKELERQNRLLEEQNRLLNEQTERKRRIEQERREESERKRKIAYEQEMKKESERNTLQIYDKFNSINDFAIKNNMVRIKICLPRVNETCLEYIKEDCKTLFLSFEKENLFLNAEDYNKLYTIRIPKKSIKKIIESTKVQNYLSNNKNDDMIAIKEPGGGFTIISPKSLESVNQTDDQNEGVKIDEAPFVIWLKEEELPNFVNIYNDYIKNKKRKFAKRKFLKICIKTAIDLIFFLVVILIIVNSSIKESMGIVSFIAVPIIIGYTIFKICKELTFIYNILNCIWMIVMLQIGIGIIKEEYAETGNAIFEIIIVIIMIMIPSMLKLIFKMIKAIFKKLVKLISR